MKHLNAGLAFAAALSVFSTVGPASAEPPKNIILVHGAWVDGSGRKPVYEILTKEGFHVTIVQKPETSIADDVTAARRILDLQDGPTLLIGQSYGASIISEAGVHSNVVGPGLRRARAGPRTIRRVIRMAISARSAAVAPGSRGTMVPVHGPVAQTPPRGATTQALSPGASALLLVATVSASTVSCRMTP